VIQRWNPFESQVYWNDELERLAKAATPGVIIPLKVRSNGTGLRGSVHADGVQGVIIPLKIRSIGTHSA